ncbi:uncharacterized protein Gasu_36750 [Galdieria sulphuraria]|uniref:Uncharacterized protein n=1 Tax=Galdieria sulphuraria TaxID=130081 RepID=M2W009_GALSU|nr:uncharacterized protein Gasu_36750 [Galdieria sulphuraria]EME28941.1 hypothetical protein Gasu_36750 [Galdieria sulphuraria]|eukprot:XP_005705461.1 hypothetical protein Gasu_36750 [Galdieria sulphuraria]
MPLERFIKSSKDRIVCLTIGKYISNLMASFICKVVAGWWDLRPVTFTRRRNILAKIPCHCWKPLIVRKCEGFGRVSPLNIEMDLLPWQTKQVLPDEEDLVTSYYWEQIAHTFTLLHHIQHHPSDTHSLYLLRFSLDQFYGVQSFLFIYLRDKTLVMADKRPFPSLSVVLHRSTRLLPRYLIRELIKVAADELYYRRIEDEEQEELAKLAKTRASLLSSSLRCLEIESEKY